MQERLYPDRTHDLLYFKQQRLVALGEQMQHYASTPAGEKGFRWLRPDGGAALPDGGAALPELQQLLSFSLQPLLTQVATGTQLGASSRGKDDLFSHLSPQTATCIMADVAVGLLCPG